MAIARTCVPHPRAPWRSRLERWRRVWVAIACDTDPAAPARAGEKALHAADHEASFVAFFRQHG